MPDSHTPVVVRGTEILATDQRHEYRQKLARIALDEMYQFVAVLDAEGTLLEVNRAALRQGGGLTLAGRRGQAVLAVLLVGGLERHAGYPSPGHCAMRAG